jgi:hypothetical protein
MSDVIPSELLAAYRRLDGAREAKDMEAMMRYGLDLSAGCGAALWRDPQNRLVWQLKRVADASAVFAGPSGTRGDADVLEVSVAALRSRLDEVNTSMFNAEFDRLAEQFTDE